MGCPGNGVGIRWYLAKTVLMSVLRTERLWAVEIPDVTLLAFFGCEPSVSSPSAPWKYTELTFEIQSESEELHVFIWGDASTMRVRWVKQGAELVYFNLSRIYKLQIDSADSTKILRAEFCDPNIGSLAIRREPFIHISFGHGPHDPSAPK